MSRLHPVRWLPLAALAAVALIAVALGFAGPASARRHARTRDPHWVATWGAAPQGPLGSNHSGRGFRDQTLRQIVFTSVGGSAVRIEISNAYGTRPLTVGAASVGIQGSGAAIARGTLRALTFGGERSVEVPPGAEALSDPVKLTVAALQRLAVNLYLPDATGPVTEHAVARDINYIGSGDLTNETGGSGLAAKTESWYLLDGVDVLAPARVLGAVVALGDSITDGVGSPVDADARWPNDLARRLDALHGDTLSVVDEGIGGNRVLNNAICCGTNAVARFGRDVVDRAGVREVILLEGINDISYSDHTGPLTAPHTDVSAAQIIAGDKLIIAQAHAAGLKILGATLTPFQGARYWTPAGEAKRDAVNAWIRTGHAFDGVIDLADTVADPADPERLDPAFDSGDHLHPNAAGYRRMAAAINLSAVVRLAG